MIRKGKRKSATVHLAAAVILICYFTQMIDCYRLRKTDRQKKADAAKTIGVQEGKIVFGKVFEKGSSLASLVIDETKSSSNASVEDETAYQADSAGWSKGQTQDASSREALWKRMGPSLQCGGDQMKFRAVGPGASQFAVEQGNAPPMPLSQVPSTCGYSMQRNSLALVMLVPYHGCNMVQEGGSYVLPMRWQGIPVSLWCPKPAAPAPATAATQHPAPQTPKNPPSYPQMPHTGKNPDVSNPQIPPSYFFPPYMPHPQYPSVVEPTTAATTTKKPEMPKFPQFPNFFPQYPYFPPPPPPPVMTTVPTTTKSTTTAKPAAAVDPPMYPYPFYPAVFFPPFPGLLPTTAKPTTAKPTTAKPTTAKPTTATKLTTQVTVGKPQSPQFPQHFPFFPPYPPFYPPLVPFLQDNTPEPVTPTSTTTTTTTTTQKTDPQLTLVPSHHHPHFHPHVHFPFPLMPYPRPSV